MGMTMVEETEGMDIEYITLEIRGHNQRIRRQLPEDFTGKIMLSFECGKLAEAVKTETTEREI